jgi:hypothetical protein
LVLKRGFCTFCACIKASSLRLVPFQPPRSSPVPVLHLQRTGSSQSIFLPYPATSFPIHLAGPTCSHSVPYHFAEMLSKSFIASIFFLASISSANAHAGVNPALGLKGLLVRSDVQRPSAKSPCGNVNIAQNLDSSTSVQADASGNFPFTITNFNG